MQGRKTKLRLNRRTVRTVDPRDLARDMSSSSAALADYGIRQDPILVPDNPSDRAKCTFGCTPPEQ